MKKMKKTIAFICAIFLIGCSQPVTLESDVERAEYLCDKHGWYSFESDSSAIYNNSRFVKVNCKDNSIRQGYYSVKDTNK